MSYKIKLGFTLLMLITLVACSTSDNPSPDIIDTSHSLDSTGSIDTTQIETPSDTIHGSIPFTGTKSITYNNVDVDLIIDKPESAKLSVLLVFHGTVTYDSLIHQAASTTLERYNNLLNRDDLMVISVAYPEENLLMGDNVKHAEAAFLWVKNEAPSEFNIQIDKIFLSGHSQGGYIVTQLNTLHPSDGVIANAPGPLDMHYRCALEEVGGIEASVECFNLKAALGSTSEDSIAYFQRSLLNFTSGYHSDILFVQGTNDAEIQMRTWPTFKQEVLKCTDCQSTEFLDIPGQGHPAMFMSPDGKKAFNDFIDARME